MRFIRKNGRIIPLRETINKSGKQAGRFLGKVGPLAKKAKGLHDYADQMSSSPNKANALKGAVARLKAVHLEDRSVQAAKLGMKAGRISSRLSTARKSGPLAIAAVGAAAIFAGARKFKSQKPAGAK